MKLDLNRWMFWFKKSLGIAAILFMAENAVVFAQQPPAAPAKSSGGTKIEVDASYVLQAGDRILVKVYPEDEYIKGGEVEIGSDGNITLPLIGKIPVAGRNVQAAESAIAVLLEEDYIVDPQVVIEVLKYQAGSFVVLGQVAKPGTYNFPPGALKVTLLQAISSAGGFSDVANIKKIKVMRKKTGEVLHVNAEDIISGRQSDIEIRADDVIHVSESLF